MLGTGRVSIQRAALSPREGHSSNLGAAPCALGPAGTDFLKVAVPGVPGETLWLGLLLPEGTEIANVTADAQPLETVLVGTGRQGERFLRSSAFDGSDASTARLSLIGPHGLARMTIEILLVDAFNARYGFAWRPEPLPSSYGGWRLP